MQISFLLNNIIFGKPVEKQRRKAIGTSPFFNTETECLPVANNRAGCNYPALLIGLAIFAKPEKQRDILEVLKNG